MFKQFISTIPGADLYMISSLFIFIGFFLLVGIYLIKMDKNYLSAMASMPIRDLKKDTKTKI